MPTDAKSVSQVIGESLRAVRTKRGQRQDEVATEARAYGLRWTRATVAAIETGRRELRLGELLVLPWVYEVELADLIPPDSSVQLGPDATATGDTVRAVLVGKALARPLGALNSPRRRHLAEAARTLPRRFAEAKRGPLARQARIWPQATGADVQAARRDAGGEVERRAAERLGVEPIELALAARKRWGHSLTEQRDALAPEEMRSRGHFTRVLLAELLPDLEAAGLVKRRSRGTH